MIAAMFPAGLVAFVLVVSVALYFLIGRKATRAPAMKHVMLVIALLSLGFLIYLGLLAQK